MLGLLFFSYKPSCHDAATYNSFHLLNRWASQPAIRCSLFLLFLYFSAIIKSLPLLHSIGQSVFKLLCSRRSGEALLDFHSVLSFFHSFYSIPPLHQICWIFKYPLAGNEAREIKNPSRHCDQNWHSIPL